MFFETQGKHGTAPPLPSTLPSPNLVVPTIHFDPSPQLNSASSPPRPDVLRTKQITDSLTVAPMVRSTSTGGITNTPSGLSDVEGVYERFLLATSTVVRVGRGYQSDNTLRASSRNYFSDTQSKRRSFFGKSKSREHIIDHVREEPTDPLSPTTPSFESTGRRRDSESTVIVERPSDDMGEEKQGRHSATMTVRMRKAIMSIVSVPSLPKVSKAPLII
jgi:hypothetical protein